MRYYFAYGNNVLRETMEARCPLLPSGKPSFTEVGVARLKDYRLAFTISTPNWGGPVGDIVKDTGFYVYGYLYKVADSVLDELDKAEYVSDNIYYRRKTVDVELMSQEDPYEISSRVEAVSYQVEEANRNPEQPPDAKYILRVIEAAKSRGLPAPYIDALCSMHVSRANAANQTLLALPTVRRKGNFHMPIVQVGPELKEKLGLGSFSYVSFMEKTCLAKVEDHSELSLKGRVCRVDETIRRALGFPVLEPGREFYGGCVRLSNAPKNFADDQLIQARPLLLRVSKVDYLDCEKKLSVMDSALIDMLGIEKGDYVNISSTVFDSASETYKHGKITRRAFTGSTSTRRDGNRSMPYPEEGVIHLDLDARSELGMGDKYIEYYPVFVSASTKNMIYGRAILYLFVILGLSITIYQAVSPFAIDMIALSDNMASLVSFSASLILASVLGSFVIWFDISRRVKP